MSFEVRPMRGWRILLVLAATLFVTGACGRKDKNKGCEGCGGPSSPQPMNNEQGYQATDIKANFSGAVGALVLDPGSGYSLTGSGDQSKDSFVKIQEDGEIAPIFDIKKPENQCCGNNQLPKIKTIAVSPTKEIFLHFDQSFIYKSQTEPQYIPRPECAPGQPGGPQCHGSGEENPNWVDPWRMENGYQCQIFKVKGGTIDQLIAGVGSSDLECIDNKHFINTWQTTRNSVFQFDSDGNVYYPGSTPNSDGRMVVYKRSNSDGGISEVINANICVQDFLVTLNGGVFYTGSSSCGGGGGNSGGFFRYVAPEGGQLREIARDWWNFVFETASGALGDQAVFFGPDPRSATTASWNTACLFRYDPSSGTTAQDTISGVITCGADFGSWLDMRRTEDIAAYGRGFEESDRIPRPEWKVEYARRCASAGQVFAGGGSQINAIKQTSDGDIYVIGQVRKKREGVISCNVQVKGAHCVDKDGVPHLPSETGWTSKSACTTAGGTWKSGGDGRCQVDFDNSGVITTLDFFSRNTADLCLATALNHGDIAQLKTDYGASGNAAKVRWLYQRQADYNNVASPICTQEDSNRVSNIWDWNITAQAYHTKSTGTVGDADVSFGTPKYNSEWWRCMPIADDGTIGTNNGGGDQWLAEYKGLAQVDPATKSLALRSEVNEQAINLWLIDDVPYYSAYNTTEGRYYLKRYNAGDDSVDTVAADFETYNLSEGTDPDRFYYDGLNFSTNEYSFGTIDKTTFEFTRKTGLTGQVKMIIALPRD